MAPEKAPNAASGVQYTQGPDASPDERSRGRREVERRKAEELSYEQFVWNYMAANKPVLIQGACECWNSRADWVLEDGSVDLEQLCQLYGGARVAVTDTNSDGEYGDMESTEMTLAQYVAWWRSGAPGRQPQMLYLKDWHFVAQFGAQYQAYRVPHFFRSDWLNSWYDSMRNTHPAPSFQETEQKDPVFDAGAPESPHLSPSGDPLSALDDSQQTRHPDGIRNGTGTSASGDVSTSDYRFVYLGPAGTRTPLHSDVLRSFSWSANVAGRKLWRLLPPEHTHMLYDRHLRHHATDFFPAAEDACRFPRLSEAKDLVLEVVQEAGEVLFVPSGWHHTVVNLEDTLSINHNWLNAYNLHWSTAFLLRELAATTNALQDCRAGCGSSSEYEELVQRALGANVSMDLDSFSQLLRHASRSCRRCLASQQQQQHLVGLQAEHGCGAAPSLSTSCLEADIEAGLWSWEAALGLARSAGALQVLCRRMRARHGDLSFRAAFSGPLSWVHEAEAEAAEAVAALAVVGLEIPEQWGHMFDEVLAQEVAL